jgi:superfamily II DNA or RNA helicase
MQIRDVRVGDQVRVRRQRWVITEIQPHEDCTALTLSGLGPVNLGYQQQVLTPFDRLEALTFQRSFRIVRATRWRRVCRQLIADTGPTGVLRSARAAHMDLLPHQLEPALAVVHGRGTRILIADEVGLGKTVQAALIIAELKSRGVASRVLVLTPAGLREQWVDELANRFDLRFTIFDTATVRRCRATLPVGVNPWTVESLIVSSIDYVKRPEVSPGVLTGRWDVVIVDEAHHATLGSDRHDVVHALCGSAPYVVLLTATPHNGDSRAFSSLCALGQHNDQLLVFRRTRANIGQPYERRVHQLHVRPGREERRMHAALDAFVRAVHREPGGRDSSTWLALSTLRKRALSSAFALLRSVERRLSTLTSATNVVLHQLALPLFDANDEFDEADDVPAWNIPALRDSRHERELLSRVADAAQRAVGRESKLSAIARLFRRLREPAIVFTEYRDTLVHVRDLVAPTALVLHGALTRDARREAIAAFKAGGVLLATDAAGEGLNLHHGCRIVVNLELPWNPMRLEQRIGRVDRIGQNRRVHVFHLIASGTAELRVLHRLGGRIAQAQADVGAQNPLGDDHDNQPADGSRVVTARMESEAQREHHRLTEARRLVASMSSPASVGPDVERHSLVTFSSRRPLRSILGSGGLILFRSVLVDRSGRIVATHLTPVQLTRARDSTCSFKQLEIVGQSLTGDPALAAWLASSLAVHAAFSAARLARERGIADTSERFRRDELQPGLFDSRAEHASAEEADRRRAALREKTWFATLATNASMLVADPPHIALVVLTRS